MRIETLDHGDPEMAARIASLQRAAYALEGALLGAAHFPPAHVTAVDIATSPGQYLGAMRDGELLGVIAVEPVAPAGILIGALTVAPGHHRRGIGRALVGHVVSHWTAGPVVVSTGSANTPALALYRAFGFVEGVRREAGAERIPVVELRLERPDSRPGPH